MGEATAPSALAVAIFALQLSCTHGRNGAAAFVLDSHISTAGGLPTLWLRMCLAYLTHRGAAGHGVMVDGGARVELHGSIIDKVAVCTETSVHADHREAWHTHVSITMPITVRHGVAMRTWHWPQGPACAHEWSAAGCKCSDLCSCRGGCNAARLLAAPLSGTCCLFRETEVTVGRRAFACLELGLAGCLARPISCCPSRWAASRSTASSRGCACAVPRCRSPPRSVCE